MHVQIWGRTCVIVTHHSSFKMSRKKTTFLVCPDISHVNLDRTIRSATFELNEVIDYIRREHVAGNIARLLDKRAVIVLRAALSRSKSSPRGFVEDAITFMHGSTSTRVFIGITVGRCGGRVPIAPPKKGAPSALEPMYVTTVHGQGNR